MSALDPDLAGLGAALDDATKEVCMLVGITKDDIEMGLQRVQLVASVVMETPYELVYRRALVVIFEVFQRKPWVDGVGQAIDAMDDARGHLLDALTEKRKTGDDNAD